MWRVTLYRHLTVAGTEWGLVWYALCTALCRALMAACHLKPLNRTTCIHAAALMSWPNHDKVQGSPFFSTPVKIDGNYEW